jgi:hypothetical protein
VSLPRLKAVHWIAGAAAAAVAIVLSKKRIGDGSGWTEDEPAPLGPDDLGPVEPYAPKELADGCEPPQEGTKLFRRWALSLWGERPGSPINITRQCTSGKDEHQAGRAWDLMTIDKAHGDMIVEALLATDEQGNPHALARRAGIMYMIWWKRQWRAYPHAGAPSGAWGDYGGEGKSPHTDHIHISFSKAGGAGETSLYKRIRAELGDVA